MAGRKPLPDHIKLLRGTDRPDRMNPDAPVFEADEIQCPEHFKGARREVWLELVPKLVRAGCATNIDTFALEVLVEKWVEFREAQDKLNEFGQIVMSPNNYPQLSPYYSVAKQALSDFGKMMTEFGMTPASRTRIKVGDDKGGKGKTDRFSGL